VGYCAAKKEYFYGFRVHVVTDPAGIVVGYVLSAGHVHDTKWLVFVLARSYNANWTYARSITGLVTNLVIKMTAFTLGNYLNRLMGEPVLQVTSIVN